MGTMTTSPIFTAILGGNILVVRPLSLSTDWQWQIVDTTNPSVVIDFAPSLIVNSIRHILVAIDEKYVVNNEYTLRIQDNLLATVLVGDFTVEQADFGVIPDLTVINGKINLALGLAGFNVVWTHITHDPVTGIPMLSNFTVYTDKTLTVVLARGVLKRRLNAMSQIVGEVSYLTEFTPSALFTTGT